MISIGKLVRKSDRPLEIEQIMNMMAKYDGMMMQQDRHRGKIEREKTLLERCDGIIVAMLSNLWVKYFLS